MDDFDILLLIVAADIIGFKKSSFFLNHINCLCMIFHIQPVTHIFAISVYRKFLTLKRIVDDQRNQFFRELIRSVVIGAVGDVCREFVGIHISFYQHVRTCLTCRIRTMGCIGCGFIEISTVFFQRTIYFICGNMKELFAFLKASVRQFPGCFCTVQHNSSPQYVGLYKYFRLLDTSVYMAFCRKMNHSVDIILSKDFCYCFFIANIRLYKGIVLSVFHIPQIFQISGICQCVHINDADLIVIFFEHIVNVIGSDKSRTTCNQVCSHKFVLLYNFFINIPDNSGSDPHFR